MALRLNGSSSGYVELDVPADAGSHTLTLPDGGGSSGQYLQTNGSGVLSWQTVTSTEYQGPAFYAHISTNQTLVSNTWTRVTYQTEAFDTDNCFDNSTNYRFTPTKAGYYFAAVRHYFDYTSSSPSVTGIGIRKNNTTQGDNVQVGVGGYGSTPGHSHLVYMNGSTDYLDVFAYANQANVYLGTDQRNAFMAYWVHD